MLKIRPLFTATLLAASLMFVTSRGLAAEKQQVAVVDQFEATEEVNRDVRNAIERSFNLLDADLIPHAFLSQQMQACNDDTCRIEVARLAGADYVFVIRGKHDTQAFELHTQVWSGATGRRLGETEKSCALCTLKELFAAAEDHVATLLSRARTAPDSSPVDTAEKVSSRPTWIGWTAAVAGAAIATTAGILWAEDGSCSASSAGACQHRNNSPGGSALPWVTIGAALGAGVGVLMISGTF